MSSLTERKARLIVHGDQPYNAEPPLDRLRASYRTQAEDFYVRSHGDLPDLDEATDRPPRGGPRIKLVHGGPLRHE